MLLNPNEPNQTESWLLTITTFVYFCNAAFTRNDSFCCVERLPNNRCRLVWRWFVWWIVVVGVLFKSAMKRWCLTVGWSMPSNRSITSRWLRTTDTSSQSLRTCSASRLMNPSVYFVCANSVSIMDYCLGWWAKLDNMGRLYVEQASL